MAEHHLDGEPVTGHSGGQLRDERAPEPSTSTCGRSSVQGITMNEPEGWVKLHRKITGSICWTYSGNMRLVWIALLLKANHAEGWWRGVKLMPGQFGTSIAHIARDSMVTIKQARTCLRLLSEWGQIKCENQASQWTKVTLCNWLTYQENGQAKGQTEGKPRAREGQTEGNKQEGREWENEKNEEKTDFDSFWQVYPRPTGKKAALKAWNAAKDKPPLADIIKALDAQKKSEQWRKDGGQFVPHPATWLNQGRWDDILPAGPYQGRDCSPGPIKGETK